MTMTIISHIASNLVMMQLLLALACITWSNIPVAHLRGEHTGTEHEWQRSAIRLAMVIIESGAFCVFSFIMLIQLGLFIALFL